MKKKIIEKISQTEINEAKVANLPTRPNSTGLYKSTTTTPQKLKEHMDALPMLAIEKLNELIELFDEATIADYIYFFQPGADEENVKSLRDMINLIYSDENFPYFEVVKDIAIALGASRGRGEKSAIFNDLVNNLALGEYSSVHGKSSTNFKDISIPKTIYYKATRYATEYDGKYDFEALQFTTDPTDALGVVGKVYSYMDPYGNKRYTLWLDHHTKLGENETVNEASLDDRIWNSIILEALINGGKKFSLAEGKASVVFGEDSVTNGHAAFAAGQFSIASADHAVAIGGKSIARGKYAVALGNNCKATGMNTFATGEKADATGYAAVALGGECNVASGNYGIASGSHSVASAYMSRAIGIRCEASGPSSIAVGTDAKASGFHSLAIGLKAEAKDNSSVAIGRKCQATGFASFAAGIGAKANGQRSVSIGWNTIAANDCQTVLGSYNNVDSDKNAIFMVGIGTTEENRRNGLVVRKDGRVSVGADPTSEMDVVTKQYFDKTIGDINSTLLNIIAQQNAIIAKQNELLGGNA